MSQRRWPRPRPHSKFTQRHSSASTQRKSTTSTQPTSEIPLNAFETTNWGAPATEDDLMRIANITPSPPSPPRARQSSGTDAASHRASIVAKLRANASSKKADAAAHRASMLAKIKADALAKKLKMQTFVMERDAEAARREQMRLETEAAEAARREQMRIEAEAAEAAKIAMREKMRADEATKAAANREKLKARFIGSYRGLLIRILGALAGLNALSKSRPYLQELDKHRQTLTEYKDSIERQLPGYKEHFEEYNADENYEREIKEIQDDIDKANKFLREERSKTPIGTGFMSRKRKRRGKKTRGRK
jgi:hypothetical protein